MCFFYKQQQMPVIACLHLNHVFFSLRRHSELRSEIDTTCPLQPLHQVPECGLSTTCVKREHNGPHVKAYLYRFLSVFCRSVTSERMHYFLSLMDESRFYLIQAETFVLFAIRCLLW